MSEPVNALAPVVERALDPVAAREALGPAGGTHHVSGVSPGDEPPGPSVPTEWGAARHAASRTD